MDFIKQQIHKDKDKRKSSSEEHKPAKLEISIESPPLVSYGTMENSTGALMSGQLKIHVVDQPVKLEKYELELIAKLRYAKPVSKDCPACQVNTTELKRWKIISEPKTFEKGTHGTPFSYLLPGHLPASTHASLGSIEYVLNAVAISATQEKMTAFHTLDLKRSIFPPNFDRTAVRVFPPTDLRVEVAHPPVVHPIGDFSVQLNLNGILTKERDLLRRWRLRRLIWRVEECSKIVAQPCPKHVQKVGEGKGLEHQDTRTISSNELKDGWKSDYSLDDSGSTMVDFQCNIGPNAKAVCDVANPTGFTIQHRIMLELIVVESVASPKQMTWNETGSARVLRVAFTIIVTERAGTGISWDSELPPRYDDVPASPPGYNYASMEEYNPMDLGALSAPPGRDSPQRGESSTSNDATGTL